MERSGKAASSTKTLHHRQKPRFQRAVRNVAKRLAKLRSDRGWTIEVAAERMEVEPAYVRRLEAGTANPTFAVLVSVAAAYELHVAELLAR